MNFHVEITYPELEVLAAHVLHSGLRSLSVLAEKHLHKRMALILVDDASLDLAETGEDFAKLGFGATRGCTLSVAYLHHPLLLSSYWGSRWKTHVTPPTKRVRLYTLMLPLGTLLSYSTHLSCGSGSRTGLSP